MGGVGQFLRKISQAKVGRIGAAWTAQAAGMVLTNPAIADIDGDGRMEIVVGTKSGQVLCLDDAGHQKWVYQAVEDVGKVDLMFLDSDAVNSISGDPTLADIDGDGRMEV
ncbi:MAG: hypothetical protein ABIH41_06075, partial [Nanoarchaeota archaeon]